jgi:DNA-binding NtrC family response regulator
MKPVILLVDDDKTVIDGLKQSLHDQPYEFLYANSGLEAAKILDREHVDVIITDENLSGMSGSALITYVRRKHPDVLRIMFTENSSESPAMNAIYDGWVYQFLHKPYQAVDLASAIHNGLMLTSDLGIHEEQDEVGEGV